MAASREALVPPVMRRGKAWLRANRPTSMALLVSAVMVLAGILLYLWPQVHLVALGYQQSELRAQRLQILRRQKELQVEGATLRHPSRIEALALRSLGMQRPQSSQVVYVRATPQPVPPGRER